ncbi:cytochrome P450 [Picosynechococcus sp. PCC 73109]|uniref:cytochrome P450 n=1 Tax=Picosynechococcus sp. PCC 73109 TaxID=374982 RepID=UPI0007458E0F|nr:cytochrome P450 [Picosynechococcus sp. PCC 73109]AMA08013.1 cytochrome P450 [Picosynechococcus sp. PCC 73109]
MAIATEFKSIPRLSTGKFQQKLQSLLNPVGYLTRLASLAPDLAYMPAAGYDQPLILAYHPEAIRQLLSNSNQAFAAPGELNGIIEPLVGQQSLVSLSGDRHRQERKLIMPAFHGARMHNYGALITQIIEEELSQLKPGQAFQMQDITQKITLRTIIEVVFGVQGGDRYAPIMAMTRKILNRFTSPIANSFLFFTSLQKDLGAWSPWGSFIRDRQALDELIYAELQERRAHPDPERTDILSLLMAATDEAGNTMDDQQLRDELMLLLFAGHETTAIAMAWGTYWLHTHPEVMAKVRAEITALGENPDPMDIYRLPYLAAVCNETLRINPVAMFTFARQAVTITQLLDYSIEGGTVLMGSIYLLHQRPDLYPNPREFRPERFLERQFTPYEFMPFGGGVRRCAGEALAMVELRLGLAAIATQADLTLLDQVPVAAKRKGLVLSPATGVKMRFNGSKIYYSN